MHTVFNIMNFIKSSKKWSGQNWTSRTGFYTYAYRLQHLEEVWGHAPRTILEFRCFEIASETILGPKHCFSRGQTSTCISVYPSCPLCHTALWFWLPNHLLILQTTLFGDEACKTGHLFEEWNVFGRKSQKRSFALFTAISQVSQCAAANKHSVHTWAFCECSLSDGAN